MGKVTYRTSNGGRATSKLISRVDFPRKPLIVENDFGQLLQVDRKDVICIKTKIIDEQLQRSK